MLDDMVELVATHAKHDDGEVKRIDVQLLLFIRLRHHGTFAGNQSVGDHVYHVTGWVEPMVINRGKPELMAHEQRYICGGNVQIHNLVVDSADHVGNTTFEQEHHVDIGLTGEKYGVGMVLATQSRSIDPAWCSIHSSFDTTMVDETWVEHQSGLIHVVSTTSDIMGYEVSFFLFINATTHNMTHKKYLFFNRYVDTFLI